MLGFRLIKYMHNCKIELVITLFDSGLGLLVEPFFPYHVKILDLWLNSYDVVEIYAMILSREQISE